MCECAANTLAHFERAAENGSVGVGVCLHWMVWSGLLFKQSGHALLLLFAFVCYVLCGPQLSFTVFAMRSCFL